MSRTYRKENGKKYRDGDRIGHNSPGWEYWGRDGHTGEDREITARRRRRKWREEERDGEE